MLQKMLPDPNVHLPSKSDTSGTYTHAHAHTHMHTCIHTCTHISHDAAATWAED